MKPTSLACCLAALLSACAGQIGKNDSGRPGADAHFGQAVRQNIAAQIANPDAPSSQTLDASGARAAAAQQRYRTDKVDKPEKTSTSKALSGSQ